MENLAQLIIYPSWVLYIYFISMFATDVVIVNVSYSTLFLSPTNREPSIILFTFLSAGKSNLIF